MENNKKKLKIIAIIPARGGSKGLPRKNIFPLMGKPLIAYTIEVAKKSKYLSRIIVSTDDKEIATIAEKYGAEVPFLRPKEFAKDDTPDLPVFQHAIKWLEENENYKPHIIVNLRPTSPLRKAKDIDQAIKKLIDTKADSVRTLSNVGTNHPYWMKRLEGDKVFSFIEGKTETEHYQRQLLPLVYIINGCIDLSTYKVIMKQNRMFGENMRAIVIDEIKALDVHSIFDIKLIELILKGGLFRS